MKKLFALTLLFVAVGLFAQQAIVEDGIATKQVCEYVILKQDVFSYAWEKIAANIDAFQRLVQSYVARGYVPYGDLIVTTGENGTPDFMIQVMVKYK